VTFEGDSQANEQVAGNVGIKYKSIIKPLSNPVQNKFNKPSPPPATSSSRTRSGSIDILRTVTDCTFLNSSSKT
jgi:Flp pilus assembly protein TadG